MARRRVLLPEALVAKLWQAVVLIGHGETVAEAVRTIGVTEPTYHHWRTEFSERKLNEVERLAGSGRSASNFATSSVTSPASALIVMVASRCGGTRITCPNFCRAGPGGRLRGAPRMAPARLEDRGVKLRRHAAPFAGGGECGGRLPAISAVPTPRPVPLRHRRWSPARGQRLRSRGRVPSQRAATRCAEPIGTRAMLRYGRAASRAAVRARQETGATGARVCRPQSAFGPAMPGPQPQVCSERVQDTRIWFRARLCASRPMSGDRGEPPATCAGSQVKVAQPSACSLSWVLVSKSLASWRSHSWFAGSPDVLLTMRPRLTAGRSPILSAQRCTCR